VSIIFISAEYSVHRPNLYMAQIAGEIAPVKLPLHDSHYKKNLPGKHINTPSFRTIPSVTFCLPSICLCRPKETRIGEFFSNSRREMGSCVFGEWCPSRMPESHATGAPFYHVSGNTAKRKMRHLCGLFCTSCNIKNIIWQNNVILMSLKLRSWKRSEYKI
jgi:hypothetical protein